MGAHHPQCPRHHPEALPGHYLQPQQQPWHHSLHAEEFRNIIRATLSCRPAESGGGARAHRTLVNKRSNGSGQEPCRCRAVEEADHRQEEEQDNSRERRRGIAAATPRHLHHLCGMWAVAVLSKGKRRSFLLLLDWKRGCFGCGVLPVWRCWCRGGVERARRSIYNAKSRPI